MQHVLAVGTGWPSVDWTLLTAPDSPFHYRTGIRAAAKLSETRRTLLLAKGTTTEEVTDMGKLA